jgi:anthranilate/para-aminobenzoate synthase component I
MDLSIVIRTMVRMDGRVYLHLGGGIVADSDPVLEYEETLHKGKALFQSLGADCYERLMEPGGDE